METYFLTTPKNFINGLMCYSIRLVYANIIQINLFAFARPTSASFFHVDTKTAAEKIRADVVLIR